MVLCRKTLPYNFISNCAGCKERKPRSLHGKTCRRQKLKQQYENLRWIHFQLCCFLFFEESISKHFLVLSNFFMRKQVFLFAKKKKKITEIMSFRGLHWLQSLVVQMTLEKKKSSSMDKILNKLRMAERKAHTMRSEALAHQGHQVPKTSRKVVSFRKYVRLGSFRRCFSTDAF